MLGEGYYNRHSRPQHVAASSAYPLLERACAEIPRSSPVRVADFGSSQGRNSMEPMARIVSALAEVPLEITHLDQMHNDFNSLFQELSSPRSYLGRPGVLASARGGSFYQSCFHPRQLHLAWSCIATHWLSRLPEPMQGHLWSALASNQEVYARQARADWAAFVGHRELELLPGGQLVMVGSGAGEDGCSGAEALMELVWKTLREVRQEPGPGIGTYYRKREEWLAPLGENWQVLEARIVDLDESQILDPTLSPRERARAVVGFLKAAFHPALLGEDPGHDFYRLLEDRVAARPEDSRCNWKLFLLRCRQQTR